MGQAGSVEQKNAIRDVVNLKTSTEKTEMLEVLQRFCTYFPYEVSSKNEERDFFFFFFFKKHIKNMNRNTL
jgi:hypothetical protein